MWGSDLKTFVPRDYGSNECYLHLVLHNILAVAFIKDIVFFVKYRYDSFATICVSVNCEIIFFH